MDQRIERLAKIIVNHSIEAKKGEKVLIESCTEAAPFILELYKQILLKGAIPITKITLPGMAYVYYKNATYEQLRHFPEANMYEMKKIDCWIGISCSSNLKELSNIEPKKLTLRSKITRPITNERLKKKWVVVAFPTNAFAQEADMSLEEFENFVYGACIQDWNRVKARLEKIRKVLQKAEKIRVVADDTDLTFSNKGRIWVSDFGKNNMPGGEIFTAPVETSVEGYIKFDIPAISGGKELTGVFFEFKKGKIVKATAEKNQDYLHALLKTDKGSSYLGECGIGCNYSIKRHVKHILFDEKIGGTVHFAIGSAYEECNGKNKSAIHLDFIKDLRKNGKIYADGKLIQNKGKFLI